MNENLEFNENPSEKSILFSTLTGDELSELKAELGLSMSTDTLLICQSYYREHGYNEISASVLHFLDTLAVCTKRTADNILINEVEADSREIFETYMDLMRKQSIISKSESAPLSLSSALEVANRYATITGKGTPRELYISGISVCKAVL